MKHCQLCNVDFPDTHRFCASCGGALVAPGSASMSAPGGASKSAPCCPKCGATLRPSWTFCGHCGAGVKPSAPREQSFASTPASFATQANVLEENGVDSTRPCPSCRQPMEDEGVFCEHCGATVTVVDLPVSPRPTPPPLAVTLAVPDIEPRGLETVPLRHAPVETPPETRAAPPDASPVVVASPTSHQIFDDSASTPLEKRFPRGEKPLEAIPPLIGDVRDHRAAAGEEENEEQEDETDEAAEVEPLRTDDVAGSVMGETSMEFAPRPTTSIYDIEERDVKSFSQAPATPSNRMGVIVAGIAAACVLSVVVAVAVWNLLEDDTPSNSLSTSKEATTDDSTTPATLATPPGMVYVPGGSFQMGRNNGDAFERPQHTVSIAPFFIDRYEVTRDEYQKFIDATGRTAPGWPGGRFETGTGKLPVTGVTWIDANAYAAWANKRLPTEEEWEFAARGSEGRLYPWGNEWTPGLANADSSSRQGLSAVGEFKGVSPFGVIDMTGNAWEWTASDWQAYPGANPFDGNAKNFKVIRGGYWGSRAAKATTTFRRGWPMQGDVDFSNTGFRCVKSLSTQTAATTP